MFALASYSVFSVLIAVALTGNNAVVIPIENQVHVDKGCQLSRPSRSHGRLQSCPSQFITSNYLFIVIHSYSMSPNGSSWAAWANPLSTSSGSTDTIEFCPSLVDTCGISSTVNVARSKILSYAFFFLLYYI